MSQDDGRLVDLPPPPIPSQTKPLPAVGGRPSIYTPELRDAICERLAAGRTLRSVCRDADMPDRKTVRLWIIENKGEILNGQELVAEGFFPHYTRARDAGLDETLDETLDIADDSSNDYMEIESKSGRKKIIFDKEAVLRSKLRVETRMKYLENMRPRKHGVAVQMLDKDGKPTNPSSNDGIKDFLAGVEAVIRASAPDGKTPNA